MTTRKELPVMAMDFDPFLRPDMAFLIPGGPTKRASPVAVDAAPAIPNPMERKPMADTDTDTLDPKATAIAALLKLVPVASRQQACDAIATLVGGNGGASPGVAADSRMRESPADREKRLLRGAHQPGPQARYSEMFPDGNRLS